MIVALRRTPDSAIAWSIGATALSFAALVGRDACALRYIGARISFPALLLASFCGSALGNAAGFGGLTAAAARYRVYGAVGIKPDDVARLLLFVMGGFALGLAGIGGLAGLIEADPVAGLLGGPLRCFELSRRRRWRRRGAFSFSDCAARFGSAGFHWSRRAGARGDTTRIDVDPAVGRRDGVMGAVAADACRLRHFRRYFFGRHRAWRREPHSRRGWRVRIGRPLGVPRPRAFTRRSGGAAGVSRRLLCAAARRFRRPVCLLRGPGRGGASSTELSTSVSPASPLACRRSSSEFLTFAAESCCLSPGRRRRSATA